MPQVCLKITGWMTRTARNVMIVRVSLLLGGASIIAGYVVRQTSIYNVHR